MKVKNANGTARWSKPTLCSCTSWIDHWDKNSDYQLQDYCRACGKIVGANNLVGGHVVKVNSTDQKIYIIPICGECNNKSDLEFYVNEGELVHVNATKCKLKNIFDVLRNTK